MRKIFWIGLVFILVGVGYGKVFAERSNGKRGRRWVGQSKGVEKKPSEGSVGVAKPLKRKSPRSLKPTLRFLLKQNKRDAVSSPVKVGRQFALPARRDSRDPVVSLGKMYGQVKTQNIDLKILRERLVQAELIRYKAWSILKPQVSLSGIYTRNQFEAGFSSGASLRPLLRLFEGFPIPEEQRREFEQAANAPANIFQPINQWTFQLQLNWSFFNLRAIPLIQGAYLSADQIRKVAQQTRREIMFAATRAYYSVLLADGVVDISRQSVLNAKERLSIARARFQAGVTPSLTVTRAKLDLVKAEQNLIQAQTGLRNTKLAVALLLNKKDYRFRPQRPSTPNYPKGKVSAWTSAALLQREEVHAAHLAVEVAQKNVAEVWLRFVPTLALQTLLRGSNVPAIGTDQNTQWTISVVASMNLYEGGLRYSALQENMSKLRQAKYEWHKAKRKVQNEVSVAVLSVQNARASLQTAKQQLSLARKSYRLTRERYKTGVATPVEVSDATVALDSAKISVLREKLSLELAVLSLRRAIGSFSWKRKL